MAAGKHAKKRSAKGRFVSSKTAKVTSVSRPKRKRRRRNPDDTGAALIAPSVTPNPPPMQDLVEFILPGFGGYAVTKFLARVVNTQLAKKYPNAGKHLAAGSTIAAFLAAWFLLHRVKRLAKYHTPAVVGSAIASLQTLVRLYLPKYGWMVADFEPQTSLLSNVSVPLTSSSNVETLFPGGPEVVDDGETAEDISDLDLGSLGSLGSGGEAESYADMN